MTTAKGTLVRLIASRTTAVFIVDGIQQTFTATISPALQPFTSVVNSAAEYKTISYSIPYCTALDSFAVQCSRHRKPCSPVQALANIVLHGINIVQIQCNTSTVRLV